MKIVILGVPIAQKRPKVVRRGKFIHTYDPSAKDKKRILKEIVNIPKSSLNKPLAISMKFFMPIPKSLSIKKQKQLEGTFHTKRPDIDNLYKFYSDLLQGIYYKDDSYISRIIDLCKIYSFNPRVEIFINEIK